MLNFIDNKAETKMLLAGIEAIARGGLAPRIALDLTYPAIPTAEFIDPFRIPYKIYSGPRIREFKARLSNSWQ